MRYVLKRFEEAFEILVRPERYVRLDEELEHALQTLVRINDDQDPQTLNEWDAGVRIGVRQVALDMLRFGMRYQWTIEANLRAWEQLTVREQEVAALVCLGHSNREIANRLSIAPSMAKTHVRNVLQKFHLNAKVELMMIL